MWPHHVRREGKGLRGGEGGKTVRKEKKKTLAGVVDVGCGLTDPDSRWPAAGGVAVGDGSEPDARGGCGLPDRGADAVGATLRIEESCLEKTYASIHSWQQS